MGQSTTQEVVSKTAPEIYVDSSQFPAEDHSAMELYRTILHVFYITYIMLQNIM